MCVNKIVLITLIHCYADTSTSDSTFIVQIYIFNVRARTICVNWSFLRDTDLGSNVFADTCERSL